jgi:hypothetical protein
MRLLALAALAAILVAAPPAMAADSEAAGQMVVLKASQIGQIFCLSRQGNDEAVIAGILTDGLRQAIATAEAKDATYASKNPGEKPPLGDGVPWQSSPDYAPKCDTGLVALSRTDAKVEIKYGFPDEPAADFIDTLILKRVPVAGMNVGYWRIDNVLYPDGSDLKTTLAAAFEAD